MCGLCSLSNKICSCRLTHRAHLTYLKVESNDVSLLSSSVAWMSMSFASAFECSVPLLFRPCVRVCEFRLSCHHTSYKVVMVMAFSLSSSSSSSSVYRLLLLINFAWRCHLRSLSPSLFRCRLFCSSSLVMRKRKSPSQRRDRGWLYVFALSLSFSLPSIYLLDVRRCKCTRIRMKEGSSLARSFVRSHTRWWWKHLTNFFTQFSSSSSLTRCARPNASDDFLLLLPFLICIDAGWLKMPCLSKDERWFKPSTRHRAQVRDSESILNDNTR